MDYLLPYQYNAVDRRGLNAPRNASVKLTMKAIIYSRVAFLDASEYLLLAVYVRR